MSASIRLSLISLLICGLIFPAVITGIGQLALPYQSNGSLISFDNHVIGSSLISQEFNYSGFFHPRKDSASGLDPDITIQDACLQVQRIHNATGISSSFLESAIFKFKRYTLFFFGSEYVDVLTLNIYLAKSFPSIYSHYLAQNEIVPYN